MAAEPSELEPLAGDEPGGVFAPPVEAPPAGPRRRLSRSELRERREAKDREAAERGEAPAVKPETSKSRRGASSSTPAKRAGPRQSLAGPFSALYGLVGSTAERSGDPKLIPFGRAVQFNAPVAGLTFDALVKGSFVDKLLQPVASKGDKAEAFLNAAGFPMLILAITTKPELYPVLGPMAFEMFKSNIGAMGEVIAKKQKEDRDIDQVLEMAVREGMLENVTDSATGQVRPPSLVELFDAIFAPPVVEQPLEEAPAADVDG